MVPGAGLGVPVLSSGEAEEPGPGLDSQVGQDGGVQQHHDNHCYQEPQRGSSVAGLGFPDGRTRGVPNVDTDLNRIINFWSCLSCKNHFRHGFFSYFQG